MDITNKNPCVDASKELPLQNEDVVMEIAPQIDNFFETLTVYADKDTAEEELAFLENSIYEAGLFLADFTGKFGLDVNYCSDNLAKNYCLPSDGEQPTTAEDYLPENGFESDGGCSFATIQPDFWKAVAEEYRYLWRWVSQ